MVVISCWWFQVDPYFHQVLILSAAATIFKCFLMTEVNDSNHQLISYQHSMTHMYGSHSASCGFNHYHTMISSSLSSFGAGDDCVDMECNHQIISPWHISCLTGNISGSVVFYVLCTSCLLLYICCMIDLHH